MTAGAIQCADVIVAFCGGMFPRNLATRKACEKGTCVASTRARGIEDFLIEDILDVDYALMIRVCEKICALFEKTEVCRVKIPALPRRGIQMPLFVKTILTNCTIIGCTDKPPVKDGTLVIEGDKIAELRAGTYQKAAGEGEVRVFDLEGGYVLPGLWNVHAHLGDLIPDPKHLLETESAIDYAIRAGRNAMDAIRVGVTGIRVLGEDHFADVAWKGAFDSRVFVGPRLFVCGRAISATGGHGYGTLGAVEVDGPYEMRKAVREQLKHGADQIKLMVTGGVMTAARGCKSLNSCRTRSKRPPSSRT